MSNFGTMKQDLVLLGMAGLLNTDFGALLNKCQREEIESWEWSFLQQSTIINSIIPYQVGAVNLTQGSSTVTSVLPFGNGWNASMIGWYLWAGPTLTTPVIIADVPNSATLTLSQPWGAVTALNQGYVIQPLFYSVAPLIEVYRVSQIDPLTQTSREVLFRIDPSRIATGGAPCLRWSPAQFDQFGNYQIELWPRPYSALPYICEGKLGPTDMINVTDLPLIPSQVLEAKAMMYAARAIYASGGDARWANVAGMYQADYLRELEVAKRADNKRAVTLGIKADDSTSNFGMDILYNHDFGGNNTSVI